jgi:hypothetical protein
LLGLAAETDSTKNPGDVLKFFPVQADVAETNWQYAKLAKVICL